jgi:hypothetical protein
VDLQRARSGERTSPLITAFSHLPTSAMQRCQSAAHNSDGEGLDYSNWYHRVWVPATFAIKRAGLQFHVLRRTNATALVQEGVDVKTAQERLGHSDPRLTIGLYAQVTKAGERDAADRLGDRFRPGQSAVVRPSRGMDARWHAGQKKQGTSKGALNRKKIGREGGIRTRDLSVPNAAR